MITHEWMMVSDDELTLMIKGYVMKLLKSVIA